jgi:2-phospho-L-lactate/phosphoenolpyruvate guanylyltransferase
MRTQAIVPVKSFAAAKQRLAERLASGSRQSLMQAMMSDVLAALRRTTLVDEISVVTADPLAETLAMGDRVSVVRDTEQAGQSAAAEIGVRHARALGFDRVLLAPGDTPLLDPGEVDALLARCERDDLEAAIVPDRHGTGTNALVLTPPDCLPPAFGPGSRERHEELARARGLRHRVEEVQSLAVDVDTADDLADLTALLEQQRGAAARTRGALRQLGRVGSAPAHGVPGARLEV